MRSTGMAMLRQLPTPQPCKEQKQVCRPWGFLCCLDRFRFCLYRVDDNRLASALGGCRMNRV